MSDYIASALSRDTHFRIFAVDATETVREAQRRHDTWSAASAALGRTLVATALLSASGLKNRDDMLTVRIKGDGPVGSIITDGTEIGTVRGYVQEPHVNLPLNLVGKIDVARAVGKHGMLAVTKDIGIGEPFTGQVPLVSGELAEDFTYYLAKSEQIPAAVGLSVFVNADNSVQVAGGFMLQALPGADDAELAALEANVKTLPLVSELLKSGLTPEQIIQRIAGDAPVQFLDTQSLRFACNCSKAHFGDIMATLPHEQLQEMIDEDGGAETTCKFCGNQYHYSVADLKALIARHE
ncbi:MULTISPECIES: Hsp33 family molecular chaperone HslO [Lacticaseibacillus]|uniref:33 kDa chaperonin n=1 Tax=Lacticaseibacillus zeae subsp. silagei TaxID=3068307 RepID=A0ABD7Z7T5_LACZE|nr:MULTISPECIES: Hsp33 family molecular chaperone HslO [Lacticaseibacillus]OFR99253.1 molecular chaperone Hsp33 [Lactobacillus sp. HMSC068F07]KLI75856.1 molecular chaperone Hsp33 [Lacticaseibacillus casei]MDE3316179.1 Hsp33 family molecular chaperone HslO [Lacticaseibacillus zeae]WLV83214.1 Hsp33 family molecular chaperone HslO [Lacticaseibacillus sp. NCIMB 15475]WLV85963.1 Hsp33 family molecular chaperone HslO [Lacticaseibacillus sp. NCIMB 15474]